MTRAGAAPFHCGAFKSAAQMETSRHSSWNTNTLGKQQTQSSEQEKMKPISSVSCWVICLLVSGVVLSEASRRAVSKSNKRNEISQDEENDSDPRPRTSNFGVPNTSIEAPAGAHDFSASDPNFQAHRQRLEFTQLDSGALDPKGNHPKHDNPLARIQRVIEEGGE